jgi:valyl-tRNA synthetase
MDSKSGDLIEPVLKPQWWVNCKPLAEEAIKVGVVLYSRCGSQILTVFLHAAYPGWGVSNYT